MNLKVIEGHLSDLYLMMCSEPKGHWRSFEWFVFNFLHICLHYFGAVDSESDGRLASSIWSFPWICLERCCLIWSNISFVFVDTTHEAFLVETETLKPETEALTIQAEARPRPRPSELETETRPRRTNSEARPSRGTTAPRDGLETEASRPRPHPTSTSFRGLM